MERLESVAAGLVAAVGVAVLGVSPLLERSTVYHVARAAPAVVLREP